jgi:hypothetical protein
MRTRLESCVVEEVPRGGACGSRRSSAVPRGELRPDRGSPGHVVQFHRQSSPMGGRRRMSDEWRGSRDEPSWRGKGVSPKTRARSDRPRRLPRFSPRLPGREPTFSANSPGVRAAVAEPPFAPGCSSRRRPYATNRALPRHATRPAITRAAAPTHPVGVQNSDSLRFRPDGRRWSRLSRSGLGWTCRRAQSRRGALRGSARQGGRVGQQASCH